MGMWTADSDMDFYDEQDRWEFPRMVEMTCACGEPVLVPYRDGPPLGPLRCEACQQQAVRETVDRLRSQTTRLSR